MTQEHAYYPSHPETLAEQDVFRAARQDGLYATDSVAILQLSRYASPLSVYRDKTEPLAPSEPVSLQAWLGWRLEDSLAQLYAERYGVDTPMRMGSTYTHPVHPFIKTHLDYVDGPSVAITTDPPATALGGVLLECKTRYMKGADWGDDGSGKVPPDVWVQCQHEMLATGLDLVRIPVLFGLATFHVYEVERHQAFLEGLERTLVAFWNDHVLARVPPELTGVPWDLRHARRHQMEVPSLAQATPEMEPLFRRARMAALAVSQAKKAKDAVDAQVIDLIGTQAGIQGLFGAVTYKAPKGTTSWEQLSKVYRKAVDALVGLLDRPGFPAEELDLIKAQVDAAPGLYTKPGTRTLRYTWSDDEGATDDE